MCIVRLSVLILFSYFTAIANAQEAVSQAELAFWNSVKESQSVDEYQAYLDAFPDGVFKTLAQVRIKTLEASPKQPEAKQEIDATPEPTAAAPSSSEEDNPLLADKEATEIDLKTIEAEKEKRSAELRLQSYNSTEKITDRDQIEFIQRALYERLFGDSLDFPDGRVGKRTRKMIRTFQKNNDLEITRLVTVGLYNRLSDLPPAPSIWGAVSATVSGSYNTAWNYTTREEAVRKAYNSCRARRAGRCITSSDYANKTVDGWLGSYRCRWRTSKGRSTSVWTHTATDVERLKESFKEAARKKSARNCRTLVIIEASGKHEN